MVDNWAPCTRTKVVVITSFQFLMVTKVNLHFGRAITSPTTMRNGYQVIVVSGVNPSDKYMFNIQLNMRTPYNISIVLMSCDNHQRSSWTIHQNQTRSITFDIQTYADKLREHAEDDGEECRRKNKSVDTNRSIDRQAQTPFISAHILWAKWILCTLHWHTVHKHTSTQTRQTANKQELRNIGGKWFGRSRVRIHSVLLKDF